MAAMNYSVKYSVLSLLLLIFSGLGPVVQADTLTLGSISGDASKEIKRYKPLIEYLARSLKSSEIDKVNIKVTSSINQMAQLMLSGSVDLYMGSPFPSLKLANTGVSDIILRRWKNGTEQYHSVIFVHSDSMIDSIDDLQGEIIGFEEGFSTSSYYLPKSSLQQKGFKLTSKVDRHETVTNDEIGYLFTGHYKNTVTWVRKRRIAAGATNNIKFDRLKARFRNQLRIIFRSVSVPRQVVSYRKKMSPLLASSLTQIFLNMDQTEYGKQQLKEFERTVKFDEFPDSVEKAMTPMTALAKAFK
jgi:phosphonate transport system substrate-binding protein